MMADKFTLYSSKLKRDVTYNFLEDPSSGIYIYFFDGQNLFDLEDCYMDATFGMKEALDLAGIRANVVGIFAPYDDNRTNEYTPYREGDPAADYFGMEIAYKPLGKETGAFIVEELIPHAEKNHPAASRIIGGASLGGLMSLYMGATYPETFPKILAMSSHFNINVLESGEILAAYDRENKQKIYLDVGDNEYPEDKILSQSYVDLNRMAAGFLKEEVDLDFKLFKGGTHHERDWAERIPGALEFLLK